MSSDDKSSHGLWPGELKTWDPKATAQCAHVLRWLIMTNINTQDRLFGLVIWQRIIHYLSDKLHQMFPVI
jgi:hypothetical protein